MPLFSEVVADAVLDVLSAEEEPFGFCEVVFPPPLFAEEVPVLLPDALPPDCGAVYSFTSKYPSAHAQFS